MFRFYVVFRFGVKYCIEKTIDSDPGLDIDGILGFRYLPDAIEHEIRAFWHFTWRDWSAANASHHSGDDVLHVYHRCPSCPRLHRIGGSHSSFPCALLAYLAAGAAWGVLPWTALWVFITICLTFCGGDKHWATKNVLFMTVGSLCLLHGAWGLVAPPNGRETRWTVLLSSAFGILASLQDLRDVEGDRVAGRRTLPIVLGDNFRWVMAALSGAVPAACWKLEFLHYSHVLVGYCGAVLTLSTFYMAYRILCGSSSKYDHKTYMILTYVFCGCIAVPMLFP
ncbi:hypothetical protein GGX14DRAFT_655203 [Mycena pura]|uniref:Uncharacterized protein n=1 Tax=Mycena pura TaxID=153505 RepID=A0AAD6V7J5_9AGAR|nr:hypothetical protein GGX14DRAFT_655203 [Mycena pura]